VTPMNLGQKQRLFVRLVASWTLDVYASGYELTYGEAWRSPEEAARHGFPNSNHTRRLAVDFNLFRNGVYMKDTEDWKMVGEMWERQHELCRWGGRFSKPDGNHISLEHEGVR
jgi:hypothetical protein